MAHVHDANKNLHVTVNIILGAIEHVHKSNPPNLNTPIEHLPEPENGYNTKVTAGP